MPLPKFSKQCLTATKHSSIIKIMQRESQEQKGDNMNVLAQQRYRVNDFDIWLTLVGPDEGYHGYGNGTSVLVSAERDSEPTNILDTRYETDLWEPKNLAEWGRGYLEHRFGGTVTCI